MVKTAGCGSAMRGFESHYPPQMRRHSQVVRQRSAKPLFPSSNLGVASISLGYRQAVRQRILIPSFAGSNPATLANYRDPERNLRALYFQRKASIYKGCGVSVQTQCSLKKHQSNTSGWRNIGSVKNVGVEDTLNISEPLYF